MQIAQYCFNVYLLFRDSESAAGQVTVSSDAYVDGFEMEQQAIRALQPDVIVDVEKNMVLFRGFMVACSQFRGLRVELSMSWLTDVPDPVDPPPQGEQIL